MKSKGDSFKKRKKGVLYQKEVRSKVKGIHLLKRKVCCTTKRSDQFIWEFLNKICEKKS